MTLAVRNNSTIYSHSSLPMWIVVTILMLSNLVLAEIEYLNYAKFLNASSIKLTVDEFTFKDSSDKLYPLLSKDTIKMIRPNQAKIEAVIVEDELDHKAIRRFLVMQEGYIVPLPVSFQSVVAWSYSVFQDSGQLYAVTSFHAKSPRESSVIITRASDGHRIRITTPKYLDQSPQSFVFDPSKLKIDLNRFEANDGYSEIKPVTDPHLFLGKVGEHYRRIGQGSATTSAVLDSKSSSHALVLVKSGFQLGLESLMGEYSANSALEEKLNQKVFGQEHLVKALVRNAHVLDDKNSTRPRIVMITGTSGVGKSFVAEQLAKEKLADPQFILTIDGNDYAAGDKEMASVMAHKLLDAEKAWKGDQKGELTEFLRRTGGRGVVIFNEAEKMHPYIYTRLMEFFDKGEITAGNGEKLNGRQTLIVLTSNRGARQLIPENAKNWTDEQLRDYMAKVTSDEVKRVFTTKQKAGDNDLLPEEILNRIDDFLLSSPLTKPVLKRILRSAIAFRNDDVAKKYNGVKFNISDAAIDYLATVNVNIHSHGRLMNRRAEGVFKDLVDGVAKALISRKWLPHLVQELNVELKESKDHKWYFVINNDVYVDVPQPISSNPLADPKIRKIVKDLRKNLTARVIGQEEMIDNIHQLVVDHMAQGVRYYPTTFMTIGTTGTGKTETGLAIAESVFGSPDRAGIMDLGDVSSDYHFTLKFQQGLDGAESEFEKYLRNNPDGSVLILDEASNMGGRDRAMKNQLFKKLYAILDRGTWTSPVTGKEYDLTNHIIQLTGNDGEHFFAGSSADEDRLEIWKSKNKEEILHEHLIEQGIPEALMGRLAAILLTKPLLRSELTKISIKMLQGKIRPLEEQYKGLKIKYSPELVSSLGESFFSHSRGVRSIRTFVDKRLGSAVQLALLESDLDLSRMDDYNLEIKIEDNKTKKPYLDDNTPPREVNVVVEISRKDAPSNAKPVYRKNVNVTEFAQEQVLMNKKTAHTTAVHEAGHAVGNIMEITGEKVAYITIRGGTSGTGSEKIQYLGYARPKPIKGYVALTRSIVVAKIARLAAGAIAESMAGYEMTGGWSNDLKKIRLLANQALTQMGLDDRFYGIEINSEGNPVVSEALRRQLETARTELIKEGMDLAKKTLTERWADVVRVADELMEKGEINEMRFDQIVKLNKVEKVTTNNHLMCKRFYGASVK
ncbi:MAG: AAA family ATPase [Bdellovibrionaceae bacterium]|nr:AAA family ATPase [Pseudobdellovibrionaceae bacterium]